MLLFAFIFPKIEDYPAVKFIYVHTQNPYSHPTSLDHVLGKYISTYIYPHPLVMTNIAMENGPFIDGLPIKNCDFPWLC